MIEIFQNIFALSLQIGLLIGIVLMLGYFVKKPYMAVGRYFLWFVLALRLLIPINLEWTSIEELGQGVQSLLSYEKEEQVQEDVSDKYYGNSKKYANQKAGIEEKTDKSQFTNKVSDLQSISEKKVKQEGVSARVENETFVEQGVTGMITSVKLWYQSRRNMIWTVMSILWLVGVVVMIGYEVMVYQSVYRNIKRWRRPAPKDYQRQLELVCHKMHISKKISVYQCRNVFSPMIVGLYKPSVILPEREYEKKSLEYIYRHELTHFQHGDLYYKLIQTIVKCVYWFHPLMHAMCQQSAFDVELVCDEKVTKNQNETFCQEYSFVLLDTLTTQNQRTFPLSTCFFNGGRKQMKERFIRIMSQNKKKYGLGVFAMLIVCAVILGNVTLHPTKGAENAKTSVAQAGNQISNEKETKLSDKELTDTINILVVGQEDISGSNMERADMNLLVTLNPEQKKCYVTEIARDLGITCKEEYTKVSSAYAKYGMDDFKKAMEKEMGIAIDSTIEVNFQQFEEVIDSVGGISITLTKEEADYLNRTNYIREEKYRTVKEGTHVLNGQQALGYVRVRKVESRKGQNDAFGRGERALNVVSAMCKKFKEMDSKNWINTASKMYDMVSTSELDLETVYQVMQAILADGYTYETGQIPEADAYTAKVSENMGSYLEYDFSTSKTLQKIKGETVIKETKEGETVIFQAGTLNDAPEEEKGDSLKISGEKLIESSVETIEKDTVNREVR